ncbi:MAG: hypothetical protein NVS3B12_18300 [Acidimicrobiales bacterium]
MDPEGSDLLGERLGKSFESPLAGVVDARVEERSDAADARDLEEVAASLLAHDRQNGLCAPEGTEHIDLELVPHLLLARFLDATGQAVAGVVDEHVDSALEGGRFLDNRRDL